MLDNQLQFVVDVKNASFRALCDIADSIKLYKAQLALVAHADPAKLIWLTYAVLELNAKWDLELRRYDNAKAVLTRYLEDVFLCQKN
jgi:hypothetical protein